MDRCMNGIGIHSTYLKLLLGIWNFSSQIVIYYEILLCGMQRLYSVLRVKYELWSSLSVRKISGYTVTTLLWTSDFVGMSKLDGVHLVIQVDRDHGMLEEW